MGRPVWQPLFQSISQPFHKTTDYFILRSIRHPLSGFYEVFQFIRNPIAHFSIAPKSNSHERINGMREKFMAVTLKQFVCIDFDLIYRVIEHGLSGIFSHVLMNSVFITFCHFCHTKLYPTYFYPIPAQILH